MLKKIKNKFLLNQIFAIIKNRTKLKIIKNNKFLLNRLNITIEDFKVYISLKEFNKIFNLNIGDIDIKELDLSKRNIGNEYLQYLNNIEFKHLKKLLLNGNEISDIKLLEKIKFFNLEIIDLSNN